MLLVKSIKPLQYRCTHESLFAVFQYYKRAIPIFDLSHESHEVALKAGFVEGLREIVLDEPAWFPVIIEGRSTRQIPPRRISDSRWPVECKIGLIKVPGIGSEIAHSIP